MSKNKDWTQQLAIKGSWYCCHHEFKSPLPEPPGQRSSILRLSNKQQSSGCTVSGNSRGYGPNQAYWNAPITQRTICYNQGMNKSISECKCQAVKPMGYSSRGPHWVPLSCQLWTGNWGYNSPKLDNRQILPGVMRQDFYCDIQLIYFRQKGCRQLIHPYLSY